MKIVRNRLLPVGARLGAINLFGILFAKHDMRITPRVLNHEQIHTAQMRELFYVPFYLLYVMEWLWRLVQTRGRMHEAYMRISFEREAYTHDADLHYRRHRRPFAQWRSAPTDEP